MSWKRRAFILTLKKRKGTSEERMCAKGAVVLDEGKAVPDAGPCPTDEAQHIPPNAGDNISTRNIRKPPLWPVEVVAVAVAVAVAGVEVRQ